MSSKGASKPKHRRLKEDRRNPAGSSADAPGQTIPGLKNLSHLGGTMRSPSARWAAIAEFKKRGRLTWQRERRILAWEDGAGTSTIDGTSSAVSEKNREIRQKAFARVRHSARAFGSLGNHVLGQEPQPAENA